MNAISPVTDYMITGKPPEGISMSVMDALSFVASHEGWKS